MLLASGRRSYRIRRPLLGLACVLVLFAGCSTSGEDAGVDETPTTSDASTTSEPDAPVTTADDPASTTPAPSTTTGPTAGGDEEVCDALQAISALDAESSELIDSGADWAELQQFFIDTTPEVLAAYDDAIAADSEITEDLETLREFSAQTAELAAAATSLEDFGQRFGDVPGLSEAGLAGQVLDDFATETCGFSTGGN